MSRKAPVSQSVFVRVAVKQKRTEIIEGKRGCPCAVTQRHGAEQRVTHRNE